VRGPLQSRTSSRPSRVLHAVFSARSGPSQLLPKQSSLETVGAAGSPGRHDDPRDQIRLERADRRELGVHRGLERPEGGRILVGEEHQLACVEAVLQGVARRAQAAGRVLGPRDVAPLRRLASARALLVVMAWFLLWRVRGLRRVTGED
jgi:hypothetical protein